MQVIGKTGAAKRLRNSAKRWFAAATLPFIEASERDGFAGSTIRFIAELRKSLVDQPVVDPWRFGSATPAPCDPIEARRVLTLLHAQEAQVARTAASFADEGSRELWRRLLAYRALGPLHAEPPIDPREALQHLEVASGMLAAPGASEFPPFPIGLYRVPFEGEVIELECWLGCIALTFLEKQYYFQRSGCVVSPRPGDVVIDGGACFGDTALAFAATVGEQGVVHSFDPIPRQREFFERNRKRNPSLAERIHLHPFALHDTPGAQLRFTDGGAGARETGGGQIAAEAMTLDAFVSTRGIGRVDFIKMDIEGAERAALRGSTETLKAFRPRLAIAVYHRLDDLIFISHQIQEAVPEYRLFLDHHTIHAEETVLYAVADRGAT